jgi:hypothetical protein
MLCSFLFIFYSSCYVIKAPEIYSRMWCEVRRHPEGIFGGKMTATENNTAEKNLLT